MNQISVHLGDQPYLTYRQLKFTCVIGKAGYTDNKGEGDHKTPTGRYKLLRVFYRADKMTKPQTVLPLIKITEDMVWCDDPGHPDYNKLCTAPFTASHEKMFRDDDVYDLVVELDHNANPPVPGKGSAIFIHVVRGDYEGTEGCIALKKDHLLTLLSEVGTNVNIYLSPETS